MMLGAGRSRKEDVLDYGAGVELVKKTGDAVKEGEILAVLWAGNEGLFAEAEARLLSSYEISGCRPALRKRILAKTDVNGTRFF